MNESRCRRGKKKLFLIPFFIIGFVALKSAAVMALWNFLVPDLFHGPEVTYVQALALVVLAKLLVGFGGPRGFGRGHGGPWKRWDRWEKLSDEDKEKLRAKLRDKFGDEK